MSKLISSSSIVANFITKGDVNQVSIEGIVISPCNNPTTTYKTCDIEGIIDYCIYNDISNIYIYDFNYISHYIYSWIFDNNISLNNSGHVAKNMITWDTSRDAGGEVYFINLYLGVGEIHKKLVFRSARHKLMNSINKLAKGYVVGYLDTECNISDKSIQLKNDQDISDADWSVTEASAIIISTAISEQLKNKLTSLTISGDGFKEWSKEIGNLPFIPLDIEEKLRLGYRGGFTWANPMFVGKTISNGLVLDVNSLYSFVMYNYALPFSKPIPIDDVPEHPYYVGNFIITATLKPDGIPCISNMSGNKSDQSSIIKNEYLETVDNLDGWFTGFDMDLINENYFVHKLVFVEGFEFDVQNDLFKSYINKWYGIKRNSTGAKRQVAKLMLDALYGRFGIKRYDKVTRPTMTSEGLKYVTVDNIDNAERYVPLSLFITSIARWLMIKSAHEVGVQKILYMDTDSIHILGYNIQDCIDVGPDLGQFKVEAIFTKAKYLGLKTYIHDEYKNFEMFNRTIDITKCSDIVTKTTMSGASDNIQEQVTWDNFHNGTKIPGKTVTKVTKGGCYRYYTDYTIVQCI